MIGKFLKFFGIPFISLFFLLSCGLESFLDIDNVPEGNYVDVNRATVSLSSSSTYFSHFVIYYRIYIAGQGFSSPRVVTDTERNNLNPALQNDWSSFYPLTDITNQNVSTSNLENTFYNRRYYKLGLEGNPNIDTFLSSGSLGKTLIIEFPTNPASKPTLELNNAGSLEGKRVLFRANSGPGIIFDPKPGDPNKHRYFQNDSELFNNANAYPTAPLINADTVGLTAGAGASTYVSMYIAAVGKDYLTVFYSQPTFLGIFKLPESGN